MNGTEKQIKWADQIVSSAISELEEIIKKYSDKFDKKPSEFNKSILNEYKFHADLLIPMLNSLSDSAKIIDCRLAIENTKKCTKHTTWQFLHYACGVEESKLPEIPDNF